jgi:hypothetical protein
VPGVAGGSRLFRLLIVPGTTLSWPLVLARSVQTLQRGHDKLFGARGLAIIVLMAVANHDF